MATQWYYAQNGQQCGPVPGEQLRSMLSTGALRPSDLVWSDGLPAWTPAGQVPALMPAPAPAPKPPPPAPVFTPPPAPPPARAVAAPVPAPFQPQPQQPPQPQPWAAVQPHAPAAAYGQSAVVAEEVVDILRSTKPWVRFLSVLGFLGLGLLVLGCLAILVIPMGPMGSMPIGPRIGASFAYLLMGLVQFPAVLFLSRYASRISRLAGTNAPIDLEDALRAQKSFWKYLGILTLVMMILYVLVIVGVLIFAGASIFGR